MFPGKGVGEKRGTFRPREITQMEGERKQYFFSVCQLWAWSCVQGPLGCLLRDTICKGPDYVSKATVRTFPKVGSFHAYGKGRCAVLRKSHGRAQREPGLHSSESSPHALFVGQ